MAIKGRVINNFEKLILLIRKICNLSFSNIHEFNITLSSSSPRMAIVLLILLISRHSCTFMSLHKYHFR